MISIFLLLIESIICKDFDPNKYNSLVIYQVMVSSFQDGDPSVGYGTGYGPSSHKGDLRGIINALDYIKGLNVNALWLTPIFDSTNTNQDTRLKSTGYFAGDYFNVDPNFGTNEIFRELVQKAHEKGLYVILDGVFGHNGGNMKPSPKGRYPQGNNEHPVLYPTSLDFYREVAQYWINEYEIDGWRLDQCYQMNQNYNYMKEIREAIESACLARKKAGKEWGTLGYIVGEDWHGQNEIQYNTYGGAGLRSAFDFPSRYCLVQTLASEESGKGGYDINNMMYIFKSPSDKGYNHELGYIYPNLFISNHDVFRFGNLIRNKYGYGQSNGDYWKRHKLAISCLATYTGPVTLYYGDEVGDIVDCWPNCGSSVGNDNMARTDGHITNFNSQQQDLHDYTAKLFKLKAEHPALWRGNNSPRNNNGCLVNIKYDEITGEKIVFVLNKETYQINVYVGQGQMQNLLTGETVNNNVNMDGLSSAIFIVK